MKRLIRSLTTLLYQKIIKPIIFRMKPDGVHNSMVRMGRILQAVRLEVVFSPLFAHHDKSLEQKILGLSFKNPVGLSAGLDKNAELPPLMKAVGFGFATVGSITAEAAPGNKRPWYHRLPNTKSIVVNAGLPNHGLSVIGPRIERYRQSLFDDFHLVASIAKTNSQSTNTDEKGIVDYIKGLSGVQNNPRVKMIEINISCPNTFGGEPFTRPDALDALLAEVDKCRLKQPLTIKMPIDKPWAEFNQLLQVILKHDVQAVTIGNLQKDRSAVDLKDPLPDSIPGNLSGRPCFEPSNNLIRRTYEAYGDKLIIIGVGGVFTADDAYEKIRNGASLVEIITGLIFNGPQVVGEINEGVADLLKRDGFANISEAVGSGLGKS